MGTTTTMLPHNQKCSITWSLYMNIPPPISTIERRWVFLLSGEGELLLLLLCCCPDYSGMWMKWTITSKKTPVTYGPTDVPDVICQQFQSLSQMTQISDQERSSVCRQGLLACADDCDTKNKTDDNSRGSKKRGWCLLLLSICFDGWMDEWMDG